MITLKINNKVIEVEEGSTILKAASNEGIEIPTMCYYDGMDHFTSCMICVVKDKSNGKLIPSCSVAATSGMDIITYDDEIYQARKSSLELLLSDHVGDCEAPCKLSCPAHMDIPKMNRLLAAGGIDEALKIVYKDIALPSVLGRICHAPCEKACHRGTIDDPVSICLLKRYAGDFGKNSVIQTPLLEGHSRVAVIGSGPAGLSASFYLRQLGIEVQIFDKNPLPGGMLRSAIPIQKLPHDVLDKEIKFIEDSGIVFNQNTDIDAKKFNELRNEFNAIILATGSINDDHSSWGLEVKEKGFIINRSTFETSIPGIFAIGNSLRTTKHAIRSLGHGKDVVASIIQYLNKEDLNGKTNKFNSRFGKLIEEEFYEYLKESTTLARKYPDEGIEKGYSKEEVIKEAARCLHCDCRKLDNCKLRDYSDEYKADQKKYNYGERNSIIKYNTHELIVYEPEKCIRCSICVRLTEKKKEKLGLSFIGRGFDVRINVPFNKSINEGLQETAIEVANACPTGAISLK